MDLLFIDNIFDPNSTPMVVSWSTLNFFSKNCNKIQDFPTPINKKKYRFYGL